MTKPTQQSFFDGIKSSHKTVAYFALIESGYYAIDGWMLRVRIEELRHAMSVLRLRNSKDNWANVAVLWETKEVGVFNYYPMTFAGAIEPLYKELMAQPTKYHIAYGQTFERCWNCNRELKHPRSKHYGIGPECEQSHYYYIEMVDESNGGLSWEELQK